MLEKVKLPLKVVTFPPLFTSTPLPSASSSILRHDIVAGRLSLVPSTDTASISEEGFRHNVVANSTCLRCPDVSGLSPGDMRDLRGRRRTSFVRHVQPCLSLALFEPTPGGPSGCAYHTIL